MIHPYHAIAASFLVACTLQACALFTSEPKTPAQQTHDSANTATPQSETTQTTQVNAAKDENAQADSAAEIPSQSDTDSRTQNDDQDAQDSDNQTQCTGEPNPDTADVGLTSDDPPPITCKAMIELNGGIFTAQAAGPSLEEARDNAIDEACAIPCSEQLGDAQISEDAVEQHITACVDQCASQTTILAAACSIQGHEVYTEGEWDQDGADDADPDQTTQETE